MPMSFDEFEASHDAACPACGASWVEVEYGREMEHAAGCAYMALYWGVRVALAG